MTRSAAQRRVTALAIGLVALLPSTASAGWTAPATISEAAGASPLAVNARGDVAVAWFEPASPGSAANADAPVSVRAAIRRGGGTRFSVRTLVARGPAVRDMALALDPRGELTVAWSEADRRTRRVRSAFRSVAGRWSAVQTIGTSTMANIATRVAAAPDGTVALTFNRGTSGPRRVMGAWRSRGRRFGAARTLPLARALRDSVLAFDRAGTAYLAGVRGCEGVVLTATSRGRRFGAARTIAPAPVIEFRLAVTGRGSATAAWLSEGCYSTEPFGGAPMTATLRAGRITAPASLGDPLGLTLRLATAPGGAEASWLSWPIGGPFLRAASIARDGAPQPPHAPVDGWIAVAGDGRGDQLVTRPDVAQRYRIVEEEIGARPADGGPVQPAPVTVASLGFDALHHAAAAPDGAALAVMSFPLTGGSPRITVWRP